MIAIIFIILGISRTHLESRESDGIQSELDQNALLRRHGYEVGEKIGEGAYAHVRKAYSIANKKEVAVKIVNKREVKTIIVINGLIPGKRSWCFPNARKPRICFTL